MIEVKNVTKRFESKLVLDNVSVIIPEGKIVVIMGESGCGKTTLLRLLMGLTTPDEGCITGLDDCKISAVFQENRLCENLSAQKNLLMVLEDKNKEFSKADRRKYVQKALEEILPAGTHKELVGHLSGGMKRRVAIARALIANSDMIIMDEPFTGLDNANKEITIKYILKHRRNRTLIVVTHCYQDLIDLGADETIQLK